MISLPSVFSFASRELGIMIAQRQLSNPDGYG